MNAISVEGFGDRLATAIGNESVNSFAKRCEVSEGSIRNYLKDKVPGADVALKIADTANVSLEWLLAARGPMVRAEIAKFPDAARVFGADADLTIIERLDVEAAAGAGALLNNERTLDFMAMQTEWLKKRGINPAMVRILNVRGDSMEPTIRDGDIALVDTSINSIVDNAVYVLMVGERLLVKRIHVRVTGGLRLISDNPVYPAEDIAANEADFVRVAGRVVWFGRSI